jgi:hypothetical protein
MTDNPYVIIRTYSAGVHCGELVSRQWKEVELANCRRIWRWESEGDKTLLSLHELSLHGMGEAGAISEEIPSITLTETIEVLPCSPAAERQFRSTPARSMR